jgi:hypothetical protein
MQLIRLTHVLAFFAACQGVTCSSATAQAMSYEEYLNELNRLSEYRMPKVGVSGISSGFGAANNSIFAAISYTNRDTQTGGADNDGSIAFGVGLGDPAKGFAAELTVGITSVSTKYWGDGKFGDEGNISLKVHRQLAAPNFADAASFSAGISNLTGWGGTTELPQNVHVSYSVLNYFGSYDERAIMATIGFGTAVADVETTGSMFYGIGYGSSDYSVSISSPGEELWLGANWYPRSIKGMSLGVALADFNDENDRQRTILTIGKSW